MKRILLPFLILPFVSFAQKIVVDEKDKFTKQRRIESNYANIRQTFSCVIQAKLRAVDTSYFLSLRGNNCGAGVIGNSDYALFLLDNDSTVKVFSTGIQSYDINPDGIGSGKTYNHQYSISIKQIAQLQDRAIKSLRVTFDSNVYSDLEVNDKGAKNMTLLCSNFTKALATVQP